jgi:hypothetical protein
MRDRARRHSGALLACALSAAGSLILFNLIATSAVELVIDVEEQRTELQDERKNLIPPVLFPHLYGANDGVGPRVSGSPGMPAEAYHVGHLSLLALFGSIVPAAWLSAIALLGSVFHGGSSRWLAAGLLCAVSGVVPVAILTSLALARYSWQFTWTSCLFTETGLHERCPHPESWTILECLLHDDEDCSKAEETLISCDAAALLAVASVCAALRVLVLRFDEAFALETMLGRREAPHEPHTIPGLLSRVLTSLGFEDGIDARNESQKATLTAPARSEDALEVWRECRNAGVECEAEALLPGALGSSASTPTWDSAREKNR